LKTRKEKGRWMKANARGVLVGHGEQSNLPERKRRRKRRKTQTKKKSETQAENIGARKEEVKTTRNL
jgi:hypothetical protein